MDFHKKMMRRCFELAVLGAGTVTPNPMVGAVILCDDKIIGEGYTSPYGGPHAEVNAIRDVVSKYGESEAHTLFKRSTIYVSLEPCAHYGKTPPCADLIIKMRLPRVIIGCQDPFARVNGAGINKLRSEGVEVVVGVLEHEARWVNRRFFTRISKQRPYVILKWAETRNGFFASEEGVQKWISNPASKQLTHRWRSEEDAILIGAATAEIDNASLTVREWDGRNPKRVLIDKLITVSKNKNIFNQEAETLVFNSLKDDWQEKLRLINLEDFEFYTPHKILYQLYLMDIQSIVIEGGIKTLNLFIDAGLWDEARIFESSHDWDSGRRAPTLNSVLLQQSQVGTDTLKIVIPHGYS